MKKIRVVLTIAVLLFGGVMITKSICNKIAQKREAVQVEQGRIKHAERLAQERAARAERIAEARGCGRDEKALALRQLIGYGCETCEYDFGKKICNNWLAAAVKKFFECEFDLHEENDILLRDAVKCDEKDTLAALLKAGANVHAKNNEALLSAVRSKNDEIVKMLLAAGANPRVNQDEPLLLAIALNHQPLIKRLIAAGADSCGKEAIKSASRDREIAGLLIEACQEKIGGKK